MENKKESRFGKHSLTIGIMAGFVMLIAMFSVIDGDSNSSETLMWVALCASSVSIFLTSMEKQKGKSCKTSLPKI